MNHRWHQSIREVDPAQWNRLAESAGSTPLLTYEWLLHLEQSGSVAPDTGWHPHHLTLYEKGDLVAAVPMYLRDNSWGEFVFDFAFADVAGQINAPYYPKLVGMSPLTPSTAFAFAVEPGFEDALAPRAMEVIREYCRTNSIPVLQFNYVVPQWRQRLEKLGMVAWEHHGYQWYNENFRSFDDYLARFRKGQRRNIRRERQSVRDQGLATIMVSGETAPEHFFYRMGEYYQRTNEQFGPWAARFLTPRFFTTMPAGVRRHVWFAAAVPETELTRNDTTVPDPVALAMLIRKGDHLLGRYWGARTSMDSVHFELCYYTPMEWAIREGIRTFDPGMGSEHKVRRGFRSIPTVSMHTFFHPAMEAILRSNMGRINKIENERIRMLNEAIPYRKDDGGGGGGGGDTQGDTFP